MFIYFAESEESVSRIAQVVSGAFERLGNVFLDNSSNIIAGIVVLVIFWIIARVVRLLIMALYRRTELDLRFKLLVSRILAMMIFAIGIFTAITIIVPRFGFADLVAGLGFSSFIIGFATKDILNNFFSGMLVLWQQPFKIGDFVIVDDHEGVVEEIGIRATELKMFDGERIIIPNADMYTHALVIREAGALQRVRIDIVIDYKSKVNFAKDLILEAMHELDGVVDEPAPAVYLLKLAAEGINLSIYYWVDTDKNSVFEMTDKASIAINKSLRDNGVKLFPVPSIFKRENSGTSGTEEAM